jgi:hypothetical protein
LVAVKWKSVEPEEPTIGGDVAVTNHDRSSSRGVCRGGDTELDTTAYAVKPNTQSKNVHTGVIGSSAQGVSITQVALERRGCPWVSQRVIYTIT